MNHWLFRVWVTALTVAVIQSCTDRKPTQTSPDSILLTTTVTLIGQPGSARPGAGQMRADTLTSVNAPASMVFVRGGETLIGSDDGLPQEQPTFWVRVKPFWIDQHPVTVAEFGRFVKATKHKTQAETFGDGAVFSDITKEWTLVRGACWHRPLGPDAPAAPDDHPVTQVSWHDATAYASWAGKRLPSEIEWEHAARNGVNARTLYPFGNELTTRDGRALANTWNGTFPEKDACTDGFHHTSPVGYFGKTPLGLSDMTGNVWQWCTDWRSSYADVTAGRLPDAGQEKAMRGGSFLCEPGWCHGYRVSGRSFSTPETALMHVGFRCVRDL
ncbi:formylglycine-generating enzyme family protein [Spirosoma arcticum]